MRSSLPREIMRLIEESGEMVEAGVKWKEGRIGDYDLAKALIDLEVSIVRIVHKMDFHPPAYRKMMGERRLHLDNTLGVIKVPKRWDPA